MSNLNKQEIADYRAKFDSYDTSKDGTLSIQELRDVIRSVGYTEDMMTDTEIAEMFYEFDKDGSKTITFDEFVNIFGKKPRSEINEANLREMFKVIDADNSGEITTDELKTVMKKYKPPVSDERIEAMIKDVDTSGDGSINVKEFLAIWKNNQ